MTPSLAQFERRLGYRFRDQGLLAQALTHRSAGPLHNERFEFLGDAVLGFVVAERLYHAYPEIDEGRLSRFRSGLVKRDTLARLARELGVGEFLALGAGELRSGGQDRSSTLADALEALIAAVYLDGGIEPAAALIERLLGERVAHFDPDATLKDPKTRLQEYLQARRLRLPEYRVTETAGSEHEQTFSVVCEVVDLDLRASGSGSSRRKAEQRAAAAILDGLEHG